MLTTTEHPDLIRELRDLERLVNDLVADAMYVAGRTYNVLFGDGEGVEAQVLKLTSEKGPTDPLGPAEIAARDIAELHNLNDCEADLEIRGDEVQDRILRMADLLEAA